MARSNPIVRPILIALFSYLLTLGGTFNGLIDSGLGFISLLALAAVFVGLFLLHVLRGWRWKHTPLDAGFALWIIAIVLSLVANFGDWRRIAIGIWYTSIYILLWYALHDLLANRVVKKAMLVDTLLVGSVYIIAVGYLQLYTAYVNGWHYPSFFDLPRPVSLIGNTNSYASILVLIIGLTAGRLIGMRNRFWRIVLVIYLLLTLTQLFLTFSRGGWLGGAAALVTAAFGWLWVNYLLSPAQVGARWHSLHSRWRIALVGLVLVGIIGVGVVGVIFIRSLDEPGRTTELRTYLWDIAIQMFRQQPITGRGLYTYGKMQQTLASVPPTTPQSHAHNLPLHLVAELGLLGVGAMITTFVLIIRSGWRSIQTLHGSSPAATGLAPTADQGVFIAGLSVMIGYGVHLLFDTTVLMPAVAITGLIAILLVVYQPVSSLQPRGNRSFSIVYFVAALGIMAAGFFSNNNYRNYVNIIKEGLRTDDFGSTAQQLDQVIQSDPQLMVYWWQQGMLYGMAADASPSGSDEAITAARNGLQALEYFVANEPQTSFAWANIGGLRNQLGNTNGALEAYHQASELAPRSWRLALLWGQYAESNGNLSDASIAYQRAVSALPAAALYPVIADSPIGQSLANDLVLEGFDNIAKLYLDSDFETALAAWNTETATTAPTPRHFVLRALIAYRMGEQENAAKWLSSAKTLIYSDDIISNQWVALGTALMTDQTSMLADILPDQPALSGEPMPSVTLFRSQFQRDVMALEYLPQVGYEMHDPLLVRFISQAMAEG